MERLTTGKLAKQGAVNLETIRYYERRGLLQRPPRTPSGYRAFPSDAVRQVRFIKRAQELGFSLKEIKDLLSLRIDSRTTCARVLARTEAKIADIEKKIRTLRAMRSALRRLAAACSGRGSVRGCPILESLNAEENRGRPSRRSRQQSSRCEEESDHA